MVNDIAYLRRGEPRTGLRSPSLVLGVDAGGTKTLTALATTDGDVLALSLGGSGNYQACGHSAAAGALNQVISGVLKKGGVSTGEIAYCALGVAGADRKKDFDVIADMLTPILSPAGFVLTNDTLAILWAGSPTGTGLALVSGTGTNCIGVNDAGVVAKIGGYGPFSGDSGYAEDLVTKALTAVFHHRDGRGPATILGDLFEKALEVSDLEDFAEFFFADTFTPPDLKHYAPVVFEAANLGDAAALSVIRQAGHSLAFNAATALRRLGFVPEDRPLVVLGGSVLQKPKPPLLRDAMEHELRETYPHVDLRLIATEPVAGMVYCAIAEAAGAPPSEAVRRKVEEGIARLLTTLRAGA